MSPRLRTLSRWVVGVVLGVAALSVVAVLVAQRVIDTPGVRKELAGLLSAYAGGPVTWSTLDVHLLPFPHGVVRQLHVEIRDLGSVEISGAELSLRLLPLLRGRVSVSALTLAQPYIELRIAASSADRAAAKSELPPSADVLALYRNSMRSILASVARIAPDSTVSVEDGEMRLTLPGLPVIAMRSLKVRLVSDHDGVSINSSVAGTYWDRIAITGRVAFSDLSARLNLEVAGLKLNGALRDLHSDLAETLALGGADTQAEVRTDGQTLISVALSLAVPTFAVRRMGETVNVGPVRFAGSARIDDYAVSASLEAGKVGELATAARVNLRLTAEKPTPEVAITVAEIDLPHLRDAALRLASDQTLVKRYATRVHGGKLLDLTVSVQVDEGGGHLSLLDLRGGARLADGSARVPTLEREADNISGHVELRDGILSVRDVMARLGASEIRDSGLDILLKEPTRLERAHGEARLVLEDLLPDLRGRKPFAQMLGAIPQVSGVAEIVVHEGALRLENPTRLAYDLTISPRHIRVWPQGLPAAVELDGGHVRLAAGSVAVEQVRVSLQDSKAIVSGEVTGLKAGRLVAAARVTDGLAQRGLIDWLWLRAALPQRLRPVTPLGFAAPRVHWSDAGLEVAATGDVAGGVVLGLDLWKSGKSIKVRRATIKDQDSDANFAYSNRASAVDVGFSGVLAARTLARIFGDSAGGFPGRLSGDFRATLDLERRARSVAQGNLTAEHIDLQRLTAMPLKVERLDLQGDRERLGIRELTLSWANQRATVRGSIAREGDELAATLAVDSPGVDIEALSPAGPSGTLKDSPSPHREAAQPFSLWSLPLTAKLTLRTDFLKYQGYRMENVRAIASLAPQVASLQLSEGSVCGLSVPLSLQMTPKQLEAHVDVVAKNQALESVVQCLTGKDAFITGTFNMTGALNTRGPVENAKESLPKNLEGSVAFSARDGQIRKMELLGKILSLKSVRELTKGKQGLETRGVEYRSIAVTAAMKNGTVDVKQAAMDSPALGLVGNGTINLKNYESQLVVLVAPFSGLDRLVRKLPLLGYVIGGALTSVPVGISGDIRRPIVVPLSPRVVGSEVRGLFERTFKAPLKISSALTVKPSEQPVGE